MTGLPDGGRLRPYEPGDAAALSDLYRRSVLTLGPRHYSPAQVAAWAGLTPDADALHARLSDGRTALVAVDAAGTPLGFGDVEADGHIDLLYVAPEAAGTGVAAAICDALEATAAHAGLARLYVEASEGARGMLERRGFRELHRRALVVGGVPIHNVAMEKRLAPGPPG